MKTILSILVVCVGVLLFANCKKESNDNGYTLTAYTQTDSTGVFLYVNEQNKGQLPYIASGADDCGDSRALNMKLDPGTYAVVIKTQEGMVKNALTLQVAEDATATGTNYTLIQIDKCITLGVDY